MEQLDAVVGLLRACAKMLRRIALREPVESAPSELFTIASVLDDAARKLEEHRAKSRPKSAAGAGL